MDVVGSEIGQKMRSAIKAKLTELGCYVDDELPDYVMVMVANKRTRMQMEDDLQLFLGDNTELFVNWLHQVLKKLQEVTVTAPLKVDAEKSKEKPVKEKKSKDKRGKDKSKKSNSIKKSKKKEKEKARKKEEKKSHKSKKKSKHEMIRPNIPPLLMNIEKDPEPSITDVFAGQILKNHGVMLESYQDDTMSVDIKTVVTHEVEIKRPIVPIIDPATIPSQSDPTIATNKEKSPENTDKTNDALGAREDQIKEMNQIEAKIQGLKQKLADQLDSLSDDEDFLNIRTEAEELMNDFAEDVFQEISQPPPITPPLQSPATHTPPVEPPKAKETPIEPETLPQIELNLPKRPVRERLGVRELPKAPEKEKEVAKRIESPERLTPEIEPEFRPQTKSAKSRLGSQSEPHKRISVSEDTPEKPELPKRLTSKVSALETRYGSCASVVRVRPRPRVATASSLLLRAVADAHKSLLNIPPKVDTEPQKVKRALVLPMRRCVDAKKIVIQVPGDAQNDSPGDTISLGDPDSDPEIKNFKSSSNFNKEEHTPRAITKMITNTEYIPSGTTAPPGGTDIMDTINIHNTTVGKDKNTKFIVTMDGYHPNAFLAKKLMTEGILDEEIKEPNERKETNKLKPTKDDKLVDNSEINTETKETTTNIPAKRLSDTSEESDTQVIINNEDPKAEKRSNIEKIESEIEEKKEEPPMKKRKASPIVFNVRKKEKAKEEVVRERTTSGSDSQVTITTVPSTHKYDALPPLATQTERKPVWCRAFPLCRYGAACAFAHPPCKFAAACTRRGCVYAHAHSPAHAPAVAPVVVPVVPPLALGTPLLASHVVPAANYKTISAVALPSMCKFYPNCVNAACHYYHPKPCRYGKACANKLECNFYHSDVPSKWKYAV